MNTGIKKKTGSVFMILVKALLCVLILAVIGGVLVSEGFKPYYSTKDFDEKNLFTAGKAESLGDAKEVSQTFYTRGMFLNHVSAYVGKTSGEVIEVSITTTDGRVLDSVSLDTAALAENAWNRIPGLSLPGLDQDNAPYVIVFSSPQGLSPLMRSTEEAPASFGECVVDQAASEGALALQFQYTYRFLSHSRICELMLKVFFAALFAVILCFSVCRLEDLWPHFHAADKKRGLPAALFCAGNVTLLYDPLDAPSLGITRFARIVGTASASDIDVSRRTSNFSLWFVLFGISLALFWLFFCYLSDSVRGKENEKVFSFLQDFFVLADCVLVLSCITYFKKAESLPTVYSFTSCAVLMILWLTGAYLALKLSRRVTAAFYMRLQFTALCLSLPAAVVTSMGEEGRMLLGWWFVLSAMVIVLCRLLPRKKAEQRCSEAVKLFSLFAAFLPLLTSLYIELMPILNRHRIFVASPAKWYLAAMAAFLAVSVLFSLLVFFRRMTVGKIALLAVPVFVFGVGMLSQQLPVTTVQPTNIYETANYGVLISDFLQHGRIPIVEHYGGHMLSHVLEGILYGVLNNDAANAFVSPYRDLNMVFLVLFFYFMVREIWNKEIAPFAALLFTYNVYWLYYGWAVLCCIAAAAYVRKNTWLRAVLLWAAFAWSALYRLDLGFASGIALVGSLGIWIIFTKNKTAFKQLLVTMLGWAAAGGLGWVLLCVLKGLNPLNRLKEFLEISLSNQNWAINTIGSTGTAQFSFYYLFLPFTVIICLIAAVFSRRIREKADPAVYVLLLMLGLSYLGNFSRSLVRHSLAELLTTIISWTSFLFVAAFVALWTENRRWFLPVFMCFMLLDTLFLKYDNYAQTSVTEQAVTRPASILEDWKPQRFSAEGSLTVWEQYKTDQTVVERVQFPEEETASADCYRKVLDALLSEEETFVDFTNKSLLYSILEREDPAYVSQSPMQLSGEFSQEEFIRQIEGVPVVLMPANADTTGLGSGLDGISNSYRYYKISEYIYQNYTPLCCYGDAFAVWCLKDRTDDCREKLKPLLREAETPLVWIDAGYDGPYQTNDPETPIRYLPLLHEYPLRALPHLWGETDVRHASSNSVIATLTETEDGLYALDASAADKTDGNYLLLTMTYEGNDLNGLYEEEDEFTTATLMLGHLNKDRFTEKCRYTFTVPEGTHPYLIRCSADYSWYLDNLNALQLETEGKVYDVSIRLLSGD